MLCGISNNYAPLQFMIAPAVVVLLAEQRHCRASQGSHEPTAPVHKHHHAQPGGGTISNNLLTNAHRGWTLV